MRLIKGEWFLPNQQMVKIPGILKIEKRSSDIKLELFSGKEISREFNHQIVIGQSGLDEITIINCSANSEKHISSKLCISEYNPNFVFIGKQYNSKEELMFNSVKTDLTLLNYWLEFLGTAHFKLEFSETGGFIAKYNQRDDLIIKLNEECELAFQKFCIPNGGFDTPLTTEIKYYATFSFKHEKVFDVFLNLTAGLKNMLMLFVGKPVSVQGRIGYSQKKEAVLTSEKECDEGIEIFESNVLDENLKTKYLHFSDMLISFKEFSKSEISQFIVNWFSTYDKFEPVYDIFFHAVKPFWNGGTFTISNVNYNNAFLNIVQALESFHRIKTNDALPDNTAFNTKKDEILKAAKCLTKEDRAFLIKNLVPKNRRQMTLKVRIEELMKSKEIFDAIFINETDVAENLVKWRDILTHVNHSKSTDIQVQSWFYKAQIILIVNLFKNIGMSDEKVKEIVSASFLYKRQC